MAEKIDRLDDFRDVAAALMAGGDSRTAIDPRTGTNKYLCPPLPAPAVASFSSCTAAPIAARSFARAAEVFASFTGATSAGLRAQRLTECHHAIAARLLACFGATGLADVILCPSGTDALLTASILLAAEAPNTPITAILPAAAETGSGVPLAAACRQFDGPYSGDKLFDCAVQIVEIPLRSAEGEPRPEADLNAAFSAAATTSRPIIYLTHSSKTGLIAPTMPPAGADVIVDACQARIAPARVADYLNRGWPVAVTGSKFFGGPAFSGAVLFPRGRRHGRREPQPDLGTLLRWTAALDIIEAFTVDADRMAAFLHERTAALAWALAAIPAVRMVGGATPFAGPHWSDRPSIFTFAVRNPNDSGRCLSVAELRPLYQRLARDGVLVGQPVELGPFGGLRLAIGARDILDGPADAGVSRLFNALERATRPAAGQRPDATCTSLTTTRMTAAIR